jgi:arylsulfatase
MATCVDVSGAAYPTEVEGNTITPMEGRSLVPAFENLPIDRDALFWEHEGNCALRVGKWKLVAKAERLRESNPDRIDWELYDLETDRSETENLAHRYPEKVDEMAHKWMEMAHRLNVLPWPWQPAE